MTSILDHQTNQAEFLTELLNSNKVLTVAPVATESGIIYKQGIEIGNVEYVTSAITQNVDINQLVNNKHPIVIVCSNGYWQVLDLLLKSGALNYDFKKLDSLLCIVTKNLTKDTFSDTISNFKACFKRLLEDPRIDINLTDYCGNTPLHYTVKYKCDEMTKLLLERGAYIGIKNLKNQLPIDGIDYQILHDFFDSRMNSNYDGNNRICNDFEINLDYSFLIKRPNRNNIFSQNTDQFYPIEFISQSDQLKELILHPLIRYLIWMKYQALSFFFIWNIFLFLMFLLTIVYITFFNMDMTPEFYDHYKFIIIVTEYATIFCIIVIGSHLVMQTPIIINDFRINSYMIWRFVNELCIISLLITILLVSDKKQSDVNPILNLSTGNLSNLKPNLNVSTASNLKKQATAVCILLIAMDMNYLMITLPKFQKISVHFLMLQKISSQFLNVLFLYLIILFAFSLAFYVLDDEHVTNESIRSNINRLGEFFIRVIGMMIGELNLKFDSLLIIYYILTLIFIFLITIVLINLLNGLAVTDVSEIRVKAKLIYLIYRLQLIVCYDKYFLRHVFMRKFIFDIFRCRQNLFFIRCLKLSLNQYVKEVTLFPNRGITILTNMAKPIEPDNVDEVEWRYMNKTILNELVEHFAKQQEQALLINKDDKIINMMNEIIQRLDNLEKRQKSRICLHAASD